MTKERLSTEERLALKVLIQDLDALPLKQTILGILSVLAFKKSVTDEQVKEIIEDAKKFQEVQNDRARKSN